jgi:hypothetical protein
MFAGRISASRSDGTWWSTGTVAAGILIIADIRNGDLAACTLPGAPISPPPKLSSPPKAQKDPSADFSRLLDEMGKILGEPTIPLLIRLRWLARDQQKDHVAVVHGPCGFVEHVLIPEPS